MDSYVWHDVTSLMASEGSTTSDGCKRCVDKAYALRRYDLLAYDLLAYGVVTALLAIRQRPTAGSKLVSKLVSKRSISSSSITIN